MAVDHDARMMQQAEGYLELDLPNQALPLLDQVSKEGRATFNWNFLMGEALRSLKRCADALIHIEAAHRLQPENTGVYISLGWCYRRTDQLNRAISSLHEAIDICQRKSDDNHGLLMYNLSCYYSLAGRKRDMLRWLAKAIEKQERLRSLIADETDFDAFRNDPEFQRLVNTPPSGDVQIA